MAGLLMILAGIPATVLAPQNLAENLNAWRESIAIMRDLLTMRRIFSSLERTVMTTRPARLRVLSSLGARRPNNRQQRMAMRFSDLVTPQAIILDVRAGTKPELFAELAGRAALLG